MSNSYRSEKPGKPHKSCLDNAGSVTRPAGNLAGQRAIKGTRSPPSNIASSVFLCSFVAAKHRRYAIAFMSVVVDTVVAMTVKEFEASLEWQITLGLAHVPFSYHASVITRSSWQRPHRHLSTTQRHRQIVYDSVTHASRLPKHVPRCIRLDGPMLTLHH